MAVLTYTVIRAHPEATINYILNPDKIIPGNADIHRVMKYMGDEGSVERVYSSGHNCSANPVLCQQQFEMYRQRYYDYKNGAGIQGCTDTKSEVLALHFFLSYDKKDPITDEIMSDISHKLDEYIGNFPVLSAKHWDRDHKHEHKLVGQYSVSGEPCKFAMKHKDLADMRKYVNHLCYEHGLSIIDLPELRQYDKEYSHWLDGVIAEGKVRVLEANGASKNYKGKSHGGSYYHWLEAQKRFNEEEEKRLTEQQLRQKRIEEKYYFNMRGHIYLSSASKRKTYYSVKYTENGRRRTNLELFCILLYMIYKNEHNYAMTDKVVYKRTNPEHVRYARKIQAMYDAVTYARKYQAKDEDDVAEKIADTGKQMNALKIEKAKHDSRVKSSQALADAITAYEKFRSAVEGVDEPNEVSKEIYNEAYSIMAAHKCTTREQIEEFWTRYNFSIKKSGDYESKLDDLKKEYRELKKLQAVYENAERDIKEAYDLSCQVMPFEKRSLEEQVEFAENEKQNDNGNKEQPEEILD